MRLRAFFFIPAIFLSCMISAGQTGKNSAKPNERFRVTTNLVMVNAVVTGPGGKLVTGLQQTDFAIFEDNVLQKIDFFEVDRVRQRRHDASTGAVAAGSQAKAPAVQVGHDDSNVLVLLLDYSTTVLANQKLVRDGARRFVEKTMDGRDPVAIFAFDSGLHTLQNLTMDRKLLLAALEYSGARGDAMAGERAALTEGSAREVRKQDDLTQQIANIRAASGSSARTPGQDLALSLIEARLDESRFAELRYQALKTALDDQQSRSALLAIQALAEALAPLPGRKNLVFLSQGFVVPPNVRRILDSTMAAALRSNTAIYSIDTRGLATAAPTGETTQLESISALQRGTRTRVVNGESQFDRAAVIGADQEESLLRFLSLSTGGLYMRNSNDLGRGLQAVDEDVHAQYWLAYAPTNKNMDGSFRSIRVEVHHPGLKVRARKGYYATP